MNGHLQPRGKNVYRYHFSVDGERHCHTLHGSPREVARQAATLYAAALQARATNAPARWTVAHLLRAWLRDKLPTLGTARTGVLYTYSVEHYLIPALGTLPLRDYRSQHLLPVKEALLGRLGVNTALLHWERLVQAEKWAVRHGYLAESPAALVDMPARPRPHAQRYSLEQALALDGALEPPIGLAVALGLWAGLRLGEARAVQRGDLEEGLLRVQRQLARYDGAAAAFHEPKRGSRRVVEVNAQLERHLVRQAGWLEERKVRRLDDLLCVTEQGLPYGSQAIYDYLYRLQEQLSLPRLPFHGLRHTYATLLREALIPDLEIAASLGHTSTQQLVLNYGAHPSEHRHPRMARAMDAMVAATVQLSTGLEEAR